MTLYVATIDCKQNMISQWFTMVNLFLEKISTNRTRCSIIPFPLGQLPIPTRTESSFPTAATTRRHCLLILRWHCPRGIRWNRKFRHPDAGKGILGCRRLHDTRKSLRRDDPITSWCVNSRNWGGRFNAVGCVLCLDNLENFAVFCVLSIVRSIGSTRSRLDTIIVRMALWSSTSFSSLNFSDSPRSRFDSSIILRMA